MLLHMRTTLRLDDDLMRAVKKRAAETGRTITELVERALRDLLAREQQARRGYKFRWVEVEGDVQPGVDILDRDALIDRMEGRR